MKIKLEIISTDIKHTKIKIRKYGKLTTYKTQYSYTLDAFHDLLFGGLEILFYDSAAFPNFERVIGFAEVQNRDLVVYRGRRRFCVMDGGFSKVYLRYGLEMGVVGNVVVEVEVDGGKSFAILEKSKNTDIYKNIENDIKRDNENDIQRDNEKDAKNEIKKDIKKEEDKGNLNNKQNNSKNDEINLITNQKNKCKVENRQNNDNNIEQNSQNNDKNIEINSQNYINIEDNIINYKNCDKNSQSNDKIQENSTNKDKNKYINRNDKTENKVYSKETFIRDTKEGIKSMFITHQNDISSIHEESTPTTIYADSTSAENTLPPEKDACVKIEKNLIYDIPIDINTNMSKQGNQTQKALLYLKENNICRWKQTKTVQAIFNSKFLYSMFDAEALTSFDSFLSKIFKMYALMSKGSINCHYNFWVGLFTLEKYYRNKEGGYGLNREVESEDYEKYRETNKEDKFSFDELTKYKEDESDNVKVDTNKDNTINKNNILNPNNDVISDKDYKVENSKKVDKSNFKESAKQTTSSMADLRDEDSTKNYFIGGNSKILETSSLNKAIDLAGNKQPHRILLQALKSGSSLHEGYKNFGESWYAEYLERYYQAISSFGSSFLLTTQVKKRRSLKEKIKEPAKTILEYLNIKPEHLLLVKIDQQPPHILFYSEKDNEVVLSFRGTNNHIDAINDLDCEYIQFFDGYAHGGIARLADIFIDKHLNEVEEMCRARKCFRLFLTGQSLGGAISILVHIIISEKQLLKDFQIKTVAFSAPPVVSENFCGQRYAGVTNIVYGCDIVPRLSYGSLLDLKYLSISINAVKNKCIDLAGQIEKAKEFMYKNDLYPKLYLPGRIYHVKRFETRSRRDSNMENRKYSYLAKETDHFFFREIVVDKMCFYDHTFVAFLNAFTTVNK